MENVGNGLLSRQNANVNDSHIAISKHYIPMATFAFISKNSHQTFKKKQQPNLIK